MIIFRGLSLLNPDWPINDDFKGQRRSKKKTCTEDIFLCTEQTIVENTSFKKYAKKIHSNWILNIPCLSALYSQRLIFHRWSLKFSKNNCSKHICRMIFRVQVVMNVKVGILMTIVSNVQCASAHYTSGCCWLTLKRDWNAYFILLNTNNITCNVECFWTFFLHFNIILFAVLFEQIDSSMQGEEKKWWV